MWQKWNYVMSMDYIGQILKWNGNEWGVYGKALILTCFRFISVIFVVKTEIFT